MLRSSCMRGPRPFRLFLMLILALTPLAQSFWFVQAWQVIDAMAWPGLRTLLQGLWIVAEFSGHNGGGEPRMVLAARHGGPAGGAVGAGRAGASHRLPLRGLAGGRSALPGGGVWCHSGTALLSRRYRRRPRGASAPGA